MKAPKSVKSVTRKIKESVKTAGWKEGLSVPKPKNSIKPVKIKNKKAY